MRFALLAGAAAAAGVVIGFVYGQGHAGPVVSLATWGIAALAFGAGTSRWKPSLAAGAVFGFTVSLFFLIGGYQGAKPIFTPLPFFVLLALFGALCGGALGAVGCLARRRLVHR